VAVWGDTVFAGAPTRSVAYEFLKPEDGWKTTSHFDGELRQTGTALVGGSLALRGNTLVIGGVAGDHDSSQGQLSCSDGEYYLTGTLAHSRPAVLPR